MEQLAKLALSFGNKAISIVALLVIVLAVAGGLWMTEQSSNEKYQQQVKTQNKQTIELLQTYTSKQLDRLRTQLKLIASSPQLHTVLSSNNNEQIVQQQKQIQTYIPQANTACLISPELDDVGEHGCMSITFATLNSIRQAKQNGFADIAVLQQGTDDASIMLAQEITDPFDQLLGVLVVKLNMSELPNLIFKPVAFEGYVELQQGNGGNVVLASHGNASIKQIGTKVTHKLPHSHWQLSYWSKPISHEMTNLMMIAGIVVAIIVVMLLLKELLRSMVLKHDVSVIRLQIEDLKQSTLKANYRVLLAPLKPIVSDILERGRDNFRRAGKQQGATLAVLEKKMEEKVLPEQDKEEFLFEVPTINPAVFRGSDIRGIVGETIDESAYKTFGLAIGSEAGELGVSRLVIGRDARLSSDNLTKALIEGITESGCDVIDIGQVPTPLMYFACEELGTQSGVMVTASHNPKEHNGLKILLAGESLALEGLSNLQQRIERVDFRSGSGSYSEADIVNDYVSRLVEDINISRAIKVVVDCSNGVTGNVIPAILERLGCEVIELYCEVDGNFPNHEPDTSRPENLVDLSKAVQEHNAELGLAFDGDGDRLAVVDGAGMSIMADRLLMLFSQDILSRLPGSIVIYDVKCSSQLGHIFISERWYGFDDALYAACRLLELISEDLMQRTATDIFTALPSRVSTPEIIVDMAEGDSKPFMLQLAGEGNFVGAELITIDGIRAEYLNGWGLVRASKTGPGLTLRFEADTQDELHTIQQRFKEQMLQIKPTLQLLF